MCIRDRDKGAGLARACKNRIHHLKLVLVIDRLEWPEHLFELQPDSLLFFPLEMCIRDRENTFKHKINHLRQDKQQSPEYLLYLDRITLWLSLIHI